MNALNKAIFNEQNWLEALEADLYDPYEDRNATECCIAEAKRKLAGLRRLQRAIRVQQSMQLTQPQPLQLADKPARQKDQ